LYCSECKTVLNEDHMEYLLFLPQESEGKARKIQAEKTTGVPDIREALVICVASPSGHADLTPGGGGEIESS
jgi:hypothetical protein